MKLQTISMALFFMLSGSCMAANGALHNNVVQNVQSYVKSPTTENANRAISSIPELFSDPVGSIYSDELVSILQNKIKNKDSTALQLAIRLINVADGAFVEELYLILASVIENEPELFLSELDKVKDQKVIGDLVLNMGDPYLVNDCGIYAERIKALQQIDNPNLIRITNYAISILKAEAQTCTQQGAQADPPPRHLFCA